MLFYERCGFVYFYRIKDFFTEHYGRPIVEDGVLLWDMVYFRRSLEGGAAKEKSRRKIFRLLFWRQGIITLAAPL